MVYCGKPSDACEPCRQKRRKCDLKRPSCTQCARAHIACSGYRDALSLYFRNETDSVARKAKEMWQKAKLSRRSCPPNLGPLTRSDLVDEGNSHISHLPMQLEDIALGHFMVFYAPTSPLSYLPQLWDSLAGDENIRLAMHAAALASLASNSPHPELMRYARNLYSKALTRTNKALSDPRLAVLDSTLLCVLLLSTFEALAFRGRESPRSWTAHVQGSATLLALRGDKQLESELGQKLFYHAGLNIRTSCAQRSVPVPPEFARLQERAATILDTRTRGYKLTKFLDRFVRLRASLRGRLATDVVREALYLDDEAIAMLDAMKARMPYKVIKSAASPVNAITHKGLIHQYESQNAARLWNVFRMLRIFLNEWVFCSFQHELRGIIANKPPPDDPLYGEWNQLPAKATLQAEEMIDDILASVPFSLEFLEKKSKASARFLIWPLASVGASELCPIYAKLFVIDRLKALGERHELEQANEAATMLEEGVQMEDWLHLIHFS